MKAQLRSVFRLVPTLGVLVLLGVACGGSAPPLQPPQTPKTEPTLPTPGEAREYSVPSVGVTPYRNDTYKYEVLVPTGWVIDQSDLKAVVLRLPNKDFFINVAVYSSGDLPPAPATLPGFRQAWLELMRNVMPAFTVVQEEQVSVGKDQGLLYEYTWVDRGTVFRAKAMLVRHADYGYEMFGWVPEQEWQEFLPIVDGLLRTFKPG